jgi:hypothetical protein
MESGFQRHSCARRRNLMSVMSLLVWFEKLVGLSMKGNLKCQENYLLL